MMAKTTEQQPAPSLSLAYSQPPFLLAGRDDQHVLIPRNVPNFCAGCGIFLYPVCCFTPVTSCRRDGVSMVCIIKLILLNTLLAWIPFKHKLKQLTTISVFLSTFAELWLPQTCPGLCCLADLPSEPCLDLPGRLSL